MRQHWIVVTVSFAVLAVLGYQIHVVREASATRASVDHDLCNVSKDILERQIFVLRQKVRTGQVFRTGAFSFEVRGYFKNVLPEWQAQLGSARSELRNLGDCR